FTFYNGERPHQSLSNQTPSRVYESGQGGGAMIVDKFSKEVSALEAMTESGQRRAAVCEVENTT
ncbi:MAG: transposase, partial [Gammaproteobacteria bacterium]|nr:transposase [Gammaproteobacteria bacterium]